MTQAQALKQAQALNADAGYEKYIANYNPFGKNRGWSVKEIDARIAENLEIRKNDEYAKAHNPFSKNYDHSVDMH